MLSQTRNIDATRRKEFLLLWLVGKTLLDTETIDGVEFRKNVREYTVLPSLKA